MRTLNPAVILDRKTEQSGWTPAYLPPEPITRRAPTRGNVAAPDGADALTVWTHGLSVLGLADPTAATALLGEVTKVEREAKHLLDEPAPTDHGGDRLARATATVAERANHQAIRAEISRHAKAEVVDIRRQAIRALRAVGDELVTDLLAPQATKALTQVGKDYLAACQRWDTVHRVADALRGWATHSAGRSHLNYKFARADLVHDWRLNRSSSVVEQSRSERHGQIRLYLLPAEGAPTLDLRTIAEHADEWKPSCYTAAQVHEHARNWFTI